jgi:hypothetical protein
LEREKREAVDAAERRQAVQSEARKALNQVYTLEKLVQNERHTTSAWELKEVPLPEEAAHLLRGIADVIPDAGARRSIDNFLDVFDAWELLVNWTNIGTRLPPDAPKYQLVLLSHLREVLASAARGESSDTKGAGHLEALGVIKSEAYNAYWGQQAEDYEYFQTGRN